ncbi:hypothetical protein E2C01_055225 [Portunus trituberculatus]|uniref:Uncharacterized protein n=1 Tax=Portunus trituberculatus TaxID=210409 RepID=A0A5B7GM69_PORTR|nr:hypothetical protein [Portunus trituberculatus]
MTSLLTATSFTEEEVTAAAGERRNAKAALHKATSLKEMWTRTGRGYCSYILIQETGDGR